jgi:hypothetical protein
MGPSVASRTARRIEIAVESYFPRRELNRLDVPNATVFTANGTLVPESSQLPFSLVSSTVKH